MTGKSLPWKAKGEERKAMLRYYKKLFSASLIVVGAFLLLEHLFQFGGFDLLDFAGHEYYGIAMIVAAVLLSMKWFQWRDLKLWNPKNWVR